MTYFFVKALVKIEIYKVVSERRNFCRLQEIVFILPHCSMPWPSTYKLRFEEVEASSYWDENFYDNSLLFIFLACIQMDEHISFLKTSCRLCGNQVKGKSDVADKQSFKLELWLRFQINVDVDNDEIHPSVLCPACKRVLYRIRGAKHTNICLHCSKLHRMGGFKHGTLF